MLVSCEGMSTVAVKVVHGGGIVDALAKNRKKLKCRSALNFSTTEPTKSLFGRKELTILMEQDEQIHYM